MTSIVLNWIGKATGVNPEFLKDRLKSYLDGFARSVICECGHLKWQHCKNGHCIAKDCVCSEFKSKVDWQD